MKRFFSALLCAAALTGTLAVPAAGAASTDTTLRVGLTVGGAVLVRHAHAGKCLR